MLLMLDRAKEALFPQIVMAPCSNSSWKWGQAAVKEALKWDTFPIVLTSWVYVPFFWTWTHFRSVHEVSFMSQMMAWDNDCCSPMFVAEQYNQFKCINRKAILKNLFRCWIQIIFCEAFFLSLSLWFYYIKMPKRQIALRNSWWCARYISLNSDEIK